MERKGNTMLKYLALVGEIKFTKGVSEKESKSFLESLKQATECKWELTAKNKNIVYECNTVILSYGFRINIVKIMVNEYIDIIKSFSLMVYKLEKEKERFVIKRKEVK